MYKNKIYIGMITSAGNAENLEWLNSASKYVHGLAIVWHGHRDAGFDIVDKNKKEGFVMECEILQNHSHAMNNFLLNPKIRPGSWIISRDSTEMISDLFLQTLIPFIKQTELNNVNSIFHYSKLLMFKKFEGQIFMNSPHWGLSRPYPNYAAFEQIFPQDHEKYAYSVRQQTRPKDHWINHFIKYYLYDSSNHLMLGRDGNIPEFEKHEAKRIEFKQYLEKDLKIDLTVDSLYNYWNNNPLTDKMKEHLNFEPILNDAYTYRILKHNHDEVSQRRQNKELFKIE